MADFRWQSMYNRDKVTTDSMGVAKFSYNPLTMQTTGEYGMNGEYKRNPSARTIVMPDGGVVSAASIERLATQTGKSVEQIVLELEKQGGR